MIRKIATTLCLSLSAMVAFAQLDTRFSQNMHNRLWTNPGYAGASGAICGDMIVRQQWGSFIKAGKGVPKSAVISVDAPIKAIYGGAGLTILSDELGPNFKTLIVKLAYSYRLSLGPGTLGAGIEAGILSRSMKAEWIKIQENDPLVPADNVKVGGKPTFDMGLGLYYSIPNMLYFGISTTHITEPKIDDLNIKSDRHYYVTGGYELNNIDPKFSIRPSFVAKIAGSKAQADFNCNVYYNNAVWGGITFRGESLAPMVGYQGKSGKGNYKIGYSYDVTLTGMRKYGGNINTHEIMFGYCYVITPKVNVTRYKNVRFL